MSSNITRSQGPFINTPPPDSRSSTPTQNGDDSRSKISASDEAQVAQRSRWQAVLLEAGGLSAALSEESMRRLKYCLHWLQVGFFSLNYFDTQVLKKHS
jgi:transcriptional repressor OPI1